MNVKKYDKLWVLVSVDRLGLEGLVMLNMPGLGPALAVTGDEGNLKKYIEVTKSFDAQVEAHEAGVKIKIAEFTRTGTKDT